MSTLADRLDQMTVPATLVKPEANGAVRCLACAHRCLVKPGRRGICQVRFNDNGVLKVPWGYVAALNADPIEKKPFFHILPGATALTFGMLGCDLHCGYCFTGDTMVITNRGPMTLSEIFDQADQINHQPDGDIAIPIDLQTISSDGRFHPAKAVFRHTYQGKVVKVKPYYLPEIQCTADHRIYATTDPSQPPKPIPANQLTNRHYLAVPQLRRAEQQQYLYPADILRQHTTTYKIPWELTDQQLKTILEASSQGATSREIGLVLGKNPSYIRHIRSKAGRDLINAYRTSGPVIENETVRFPQEHHSGIPASLPLDEKMARLLGYYCAEGSVVQSKERPNSLVLNFSFSPLESQKVEEVCYLLSQIFPVKPRIVRRDTTVGVIVSKASLALFFKYLCGAGALQKKVPTPLLTSSATVMRSFLDAYVDGDGHQYENGKISATTVSQKLAYGLGLLVLSLGYLPSVYDAQMPTNGLVQGRQVQRAAHQYTVVWYPNEFPNRKVIRTDNAFLIPIRSLDSIDYQGDVYNLEVEENHTYLANFCLVSNCQNWITSQTLRDPECESSLGLARKVSPEQMVGAARRSGAQVIASSYNEPLITTEWAVDVFKEAQKAGLKCVFVSNGNATPEALEVLRPYLVGYKIDLKTMQDKHYRQLGGVLQNILDTIQRAHDLGLWVEIVTLLVPGFNDSVEELWEASRFIASVSPDIPWHVTAFHPEYKMLDPEPTSAKGLLQAAEIGQEAGLNYVYAGNLTGRVGDLESTYCPNCNERVIQRRGFWVLNNRITAEGACPKCGTKIPGIWN